MRCRAFSLVAALWLAAACLPAAASSLAVEGEDWLLMSHEEKLTYIFTTTAELQRHEVPLTQSADEYVRLMDDFLTDHPDWLDENAANIFANALYAYEPDTRPYLKALE